MLPSVLELREIYNHKWESMSAVRAAARTAYKARLCAQSGLCQRELFQLYALEAAHTMRSLAGCCLPDYKIRFNVYGDCFPSRRRVSRRVRRAREAVVSQLTEELSNALLEAGFSVYTEEGGKILYYSMP